MERLFGTDGVRGVANADLSPELVFRLGRAGAHHLIRTAGAGGGRPRLVVGKDTRLSSDVLEAALAAGAASAGADVVALGVVTTPAVACLTRRLGAAGGAMISASHNPAEYNGIKFFSADGYKFPDAVEDEIQAVVLAAEDRLPRPVGAGLGRLQEAPEAAEQYVEAVAATVIGADRGEAGAVGGADGRPGGGAGADGKPVPEAAAPFRGLKVVLDCAHGAAYRLAPDLLRRLGASVTVLNDRPDGLNINAGCGSLHPEDLRAAVVREGASAGLAFDGDADRVIAVDEKGGLVDGDQIMCIAGLHLLRAGRLPGRTVVATVMSNLGLEQALERAGGRLLRVRVGDRYVLEAMRRGGFTLGGEQSGHVIFLEHATTGDGLLTAVQLLRIMVDSGRPLSELAGQMARFPQLLINVETRRRDGWAENQRVRDAVHAAEAALAGRGRILVRPSGTEPLIRIMVEGEDADAVRTLAEDLAGVLRRELN